MYVAASQWLPSLALAFPHPALAIPVIVLGALLPDIDHPQSTVGRRISIISYPIKALLGHRGALHSVLAVCILVYLCRWADSTILFAFSFGYIGHLVGDMCTKSGVAVFWPFGRRYRIPFTPASNPVFEVATAITCVAIAAFASFT